MNDAVLIRHTRLSGVAGICYGRWEAPLAETFSDEADAVRAAMPWRPEVIWTSPASRCRRLADVIAGAGGAEIRVDERLAEVAMGAWEGRCWEEFRGPESEAWALDPWSRRPPGGESVADLWIRAAAVRTDCRERRGARLAIVTHAGVIRAWRAIAAGLTWEEAWRQPVEFGGIERAS